MANDRRAPATHIVDVLVAIDLYKNQRVKRERRDILSKGRLAKCMSTCPCLARQLSIWHKSPKALKQDGVAGAAGRLNLLAFVALAPDRPRGEGMISRRMLPLLSGDMRQQAESAKNGPRVGAIHTDKLRYELSEHELATHVVSFRALHALEDYGTAANGSA